MPKFSIIIPLYNKEKDIEKTLKSVFEQTFQDFEIVIVNDGSTDNSEKVVASISDARIKLFSKKNEGVGPTRNFAVTKASCAYIVFLDADDYWHPEHLENINSLTRKFPDGKWFATAYEKRHNEHFISPMLSSILAKGKSWQGVVSNFFEYSLTDIIAWTSAVCFRKFFFNHLNGFDTSITMGAGEDTDLWMRAALKSPLVFSNKITARHNLDGSNRISLSPTLKRTYLNPNNYEEHAKSNPFLKKFLDLNRFSYSLQYKMAGDLATARKYRNELDFNNLNTKQRWLLKQPRFILLIMRRAKDFFEKTGIRLTSFGG